MTVSNGASNAVRPVESREMPEGPITEPVMPAGLATVGSGTPAPSRQKEMVAAIALFVAGFFGRNETLDIPITPRSLATLAGLLLTGSWTSIVDLQLELEDQKVMIPMASLYPLLDRLVLIGFVERKDEPGAKGRPKAFYRITHNGRCVVSLGHTIAQSIEPERS